MLYFPLIFSCLCNEKHLSCNPFHSKAYDLANLAHIKKPQNFSIILGLSWFCLLFLGSLNGCKWEAGSAAEELEAMLQRSC